MKRRDDNNISGLILPNSPPSKTQEIMDNTEEWIDHAEEYAMEQAETDECSNFDPRIMGGFHLGSNSSTLDISPGQWV